MGSSLLYREVEFVGGGCVGKLTDMAIFSLKFQYKKVTLCLGFGLEERVDECTADIGDTVHQSLSGCSWRRVSSRVLVLAKFQMPILELHLANLHNLQLSGELLNLLFELLVLLVEIGGLLVGESHPVERVRGRNSARPNLRVPQVALTLDDSVEFGPKDEYHRGGSAQLGAHKTEKVLDVGTRVGQNGEATKERAIGEYTRFECSNGQLTEAGSWQCSPG